MIADSHLGMRCFEAYAEAMGEERTIVPLEQMFNNEDVITAQRRMALLKKARITQEVQAFERRTIDPNGLEMQMECAIPLDFFVHHALHDGAGFWENDDILTDYKKWNRDFVYKEPRRTNFTGWRGRAAAIKQGEGIALTDRWGHAA